MQTSSIILALGANAAGAWGAPGPALRRAVDALRASGVRVLARSALYRTPPLGAVRQPAFLNAVLCVAADMPPATLLRLAKRLERQAGRRLGSRWGPRPLDIDLIDYKGQRIGSQAAPRQRGQLVLPHPELTRRGFVLVPLAEVAPSWRHPLLQVGARALLARRPTLRRGIAEPARDLPVEQEGGPGRDASERPTRNAIGPQSG